MSEWAESGIPGYALSEYKVLTLGEGRDAMHVTISYALRCWGAGITTSGPWVHCGEWWESGKYRGRGWRTRLEETAKAYLLDVANGIEAGERGG